MFVQQFLFQIYDNSAGYGTLMLSLASQNSMLGISIKIMGLLNINIQHSSGKKDYTQPYVAPCIIFDMNIS